MNISVIDFGPQLDFVSWAVIWSVDSVSASKLNGQCITGWSATTAASGVAATRPGAQQGAIRYQRCWSDDVTG